MQMIKEKFHTVTEAAEALGITSGRVRQICRELEIGTVAGKTRLLSENDLRTIQDRPDRRKGDSEKN